MNKTLVKNIAVGALGAAIGAVFLVPLLQKLRAKVQ